MNLHIRNIDLKTSNLIDKNLTDLRNQGIKISKEEYVTKLINEALYADFNQYKKDAFDKTITALTNKFDKMQDSYNELLAILLGVNNMQKQDYVRNLSQFKIRLSEPNRLFLEEYIEKSHTVNNISEAIREILYQLDAWHK
ncbi:hypothetical protein QY890_00965 [Latilactobacillus sakei]